MKGVQHFLSRQTPRYYSPVQQNSSRPLWAGNAGWGRGGVVPLPCHTPGSLSAIAAPVVGLL
jgi:glyoxylase-like metal-dependent hydrolase (beta-lactamase superfamily II)